MSTEIRYAVHVPLRSKTVARLNCQEGTRHYRVIGDHAAYGVFVDDQGIAFFTPRPVVIGAYAVGDEAPVQTLLGDTVLEIDGEEYRVIPGRSRYERASLAHLVDRVAYHAACGLEVPRGSVLPMACECGRRIPVNGLQSKTGGGGAW